jgi:methionyl-tRNA formyltransferase
VGVVTQPDRPRGRGRRLSPSPVAARAARAGVPLLPTEEVGERSFVERLRSLDADLGIVVAFGQFLPRAVRELPRMGFLLNAHASLLPRHRGAAPIAHAILAGDTETGISIMRVERGMDAGPVALVRRTPIGSEETAGDLEARLSAIAADALEEAVALADQGRLLFAPQDDARATLAPKLDPEHARLSFGAPADELARSVRATSPRPGAWTTWQGERLRILRARQLDGAVDVPAGTVRVGGDPPLRIATAAGWLVPLELQWAGGRPLDVDAFLRGRGIEDGARLGSVA